MDWPALPLNEWINTRDTLHMWLQIVGKVRLKQAPQVNHSWHTTLYVTSRGLTTSPIPHGDRTFQIDLDLIDHRLVIADNDGALGGFPLEPQSVATFYRRLMSELDRMQLAVRIFAKPGRRRPREVGSPGARATAGVISFQHPQPERLGSDPTAQESCHWGQTPESSGIVPLGSDPIPDHPGPHPGPPVPDPRPDTRPRPVTYWSRPASSNNTVASAA